MTTAVFLILAAVAYALLGGVFLAFSDFIMRGLAQAGAPSGIAAMQGVNRTVYRSVFMILFFTALPMSLGVCAVAISGPGIDGMTLTAGLLYPAGAFAVTAAANVPMNGRLAAVDPSSAEAAEYWERVYLPRWTRWNTLRAAACIAASLLIAVGQAGGGA